MKPLNKFKLRKLKNRIKQLFCKHKTRTLWYISRAGVNTFKCSNCGKEFEEPMSNNEHLTAMKIIQN